jgi:hypothetical protein
MLDDLDDLDPADSAFVVTVLSRAGLARKTAGGLYL